jgi:ribosomal protein S12 methylthiotransferase accessory factor
MKLAITESAESIIDSNSSGSILNNFKKTLVGFFERYFGSRIALELSEDLYEIDLDLKKPIQIADKLQSLGIVEKIKHQKKFTDEPFIHHYNVIPGTKLGGGAGADFTNKENALWRAIGEATERYLWFNSKDFYGNVVRKSYKEIKEDACDIFSLAGFSDEQKRTEPVLKFDENTTFGWLATFSLTENKNVFCPAQLISARYFRENTKSPAMSQKPEPMLRWSITTGLATGSSYEEAAAKGILEVLERDAYIISYLNKISPPMLDLGYLSRQDEELRNIFESIARYNLEIYLLELPTDFSVHPILAMIIDRTGKGSALIVGIAAHFDLRSAILSALAEALAIRTRNKETYRNDYVCNLNELGMIGRIRYWMKEENLPKIDFFLKGTSVKANMPHNFFEPVRDRKYYKEKLGELKEQLREKNYHAYLADLTTKETKKVGFHSVIAVMPELQPMHLQETIPCFGGKRISDLPQKLGYTALKNPNTIPHPFS